MSLSIRTAALLAVLLALASCTRPDGADAPLRAIGAPQAPAGPDPGLLAAWADFPVDRKPRPIVLIGEAVKVDGFTTGDAKLAFLKGSLSLEAALPPGPATVRVRLHDGVFELPAIGARAAYDRIAAVGRPDSAPDASPAPMRITKVELGTAQFHTDRGPLTLPAWLFTGPEMMGPLAVPAPGPAAFWRPDEPGYSGIGNGSIAADGVTLTVQLPQPQAACPGQPVLRYQAEAVESGTAVTVGLRVVETLPPATPAAGGECGSDLVLRSAPYTVRLAGPLGARVLVLSSTGAAEVVRGG
ncbi:hypothetical protein Cs7R123_08780 [Catellatospora sp. TT07R-123]|uniref:hypothetical protein n=1 Tax=Catellatospora sp. TT07R-123 TaxID=2733863 RepID=UPI001B00DDEA|nr:hypothetical protein [Catellatospora sp. TT07R-123]GHJ43536.1 hypothetical protein Cs7R123_08780 [Catellatospora sp. TT07R-123]